MRAQLLSATHFVRNNDWRTILAHLNSRDAHPFLQFIKYGICGFGAFLTHQVIWLSLSLTWFPSIGEGLSDDTRWKNSLISNSIAGLFSTAVAYITNVLWVFKTGRLSRFAEIGSFFAISLISLGGGLMAGPWLIKVFGLNTFVAQLSMVVTSVLINFVCRKFLIFKH